MVEWEGSMVFLKASALLHDYVSAPSPNKTPKLEEAIRMFEALLERVDEVAHPVQWATAMNCLAMAYCELPTGHRGRNLQRAIECCENALRVFTKRGFPAEWAKTMSTLANSYRRLPTGEPEANLERAIECCEEALQVFTKEAVPVKWATMMHNVGSLYSELWSGDREANLQRAIKCYNQALKVRTEKRLPVAWAMTMHGLANAYSEQLTGEPEANCLQAIKYYKAALRVFIEERFPLDWGMAVDGLGSAYAQLPTGDRTENLQRAIECYEAALRVFTEEAFPANWAATMSNLANAYRHFPTGDREANLQQAIKCYEAALRVFTKEAFPADWAGTMNGMANAYSEQLAGSLETSLQQAIKCYNQALRVFTEHGFPIQRASTLEGLGTAYRKVPTGDRGANLQQAIECYKAALRVFDKQGISVARAGTMNNLANAYQKLPTGDRGANLNRAIECYLEALRIYDEDAFPYSWAMTLNNLANAYQRLPTGDRGANLKRAIECYEKALLVFTERAFPAEWGMAQNGLGNAYAGLPTGDRGANLQQAIECYKAALRVFTKKAFPADWAGTMNNLANAYRHFPTGDREAYLQQAIKCYEAALQVFTKEAFPADWAGTMNNLANAYQKLPTGDRGAYLQQAIKCYEAALRVYTASTFPHERLLTSNNLGALFYESGGWEQALEHYTQAVAMTDQIRAASLQEADRRRILKESATVFERAILCALRTTQYPLTLRFVEQGKTRNLADQLWRREIKPYGVQDAEWQEYQQLHDKAWNVEQDLSATSSGEFRATLYQERGSPISENPTLEELASVRHAIKELEGRFRQADPDYIPFALPLAPQDFVALARAADAVIVEFRVTQEGTYVFLVGPRDDGVDSEQVVHVPEFNDDALREMLVQAPGGRPTDGWLVKYDRFRRDQRLLPDWLACVERTTRELYEHLFVGVHRRLQERYPDSRRLILVPNKGLNLLPLHACWLESESGERRYLLDDYDISYTPSCQVLRRCLNREPASETPASSIFAVQNPEHADAKKRLAFSDWEVQEICKFFAEANRCVLDKDLASERAARENIHQGDVKHFSCHGYFDLTHVEQSCLSLRGDENLSVPDIVPLDLGGTWLVVLSACETGLTDYRDIVDEYQGLPAAFLVAGAATIIPSLWAVSDFSTALLMQRFYTNLYERSMEKAAAICEAQRWLRDVKLEEAKVLLDTIRHQVTLTGASGQRLSAADVVGAHFQLKHLAEAASGKPFSNPHWWAAFQCVGAGWKPEEELRSDE